MKHIKLFEQFLIKEQKDIKFFIQKGSPLLGVKKSNWERLELQGQVDYTDIYKFQDSIMFHFRDEYATVESFPQGKYKVVFGGDLQGEYAVITPNTKSNSYYFVLMKDFKDYLMQSNQMKVFEGAINEVESAPHQNKDYKVGD